MKKIAIVVQRYGVEVNGGAEYHCRILAEKLESFFDLEVITTCAIDYITWRNEYSQGISEINGVRVRRFEVIQERNKKKAHILERLVRKKAFFQKTLRFFGCLAVAEKLSILKKKEEEWGIEWAKQQGPHTPELLEFLRNNQQNYDAIIFFTYLYYPTFFGLRIAPEKSILIPTAHDERPIYFPAFKLIFKSPKAILYNTDAEKEFVNRLFNNGGIYSDIVGVGIDQPNPISDSDVATISDPYLIYIGRIDPAKGCDVLFEYFLTYKESIKSDLRLVLVGQSFMSIPDTKDILIMGFVSEEEKEKLLHHAKALVIPSFFESLSLVTLESMVAGIPVVANGRTEVLKNHIEQSRGGYLFFDFETFKEALDDLQNSSTNIDLLKENAKAYVTKNYNWETVIEKVSKAIDYVSSSNY